MHVPKMGKSYSSKGMAKFTLVSLKVLEILGV